MKLKSLPANLNEWQREHITRVLREGKTYNQLLNFKVYRIDLNQETIDRMLIEARRRYLWNIGSMSMPERIGHWHLRCV